MFSCNLRCLLIFLHGRSRTYRVASLRAGPVGRISYNLYFDCKHVRYVTCDFNKRILYVAAQNAGEWAYVCKWQTANEEIRMRGAAATTSFRLNFFAVYHDL